MINSKLVPSTKLYLGNLTAKITPQLLLEFYSKFGKLLECVKIRDNYGFIRFETMEQAIYALEKTNGYLFNGQILKVEYAKNSGNSHLKHRSIPISYPIQHVRKHSSSSSSSSSSNMSSPIFEHQNDRKRRPSSDSLLLQQQQIREDNAFVGRPQNGRYSPQSPTQRTNNHSLSYPNQRQISNFNPALLHNRVRTPTFHNKNHPLSVFQPLSYSQESLVTPPGFNHISKTTKFVFGEEQTSLNHRVSQQIPISRTPSSLSTLSTDSHEQQIQNDLRNSNEMGNCYSNVQKSSIHNISLTHESSVQHYEQFDWIHAVEHKKLCSHPVESDHYDPAIVDAVKNQQTEEKIRNDNQILDISQNSSLQLSWNTSQDFNPKVIQSQTWSATPFFPFKCSTSSLFVWDYVIFPEAALHPGLYDDYNTNWLKNNLWIKMEQAFA
ncbi:unnamed protein product [Didymodactylos carnosus]|uniref:RRM domain-containing protein n=1 Tax=Didymodactylos carnosus TaxID=1234261 RepID=A0A813U9H5_9BILA|nr:unnamed protein product [Didymodactylos carnosus]CAF0870476.1 unnamed protein product [Didymodactylos carnosus]CAF3609324.1 unnamed protein product [Didymodactylos carnosus]CAF3655300.1 unnamed protein product [Didymodactylos carnosus]